MPSKLKKRQRVNKNELDPFEVQYLMRGYSVLPIDTTKLQLKVLWERHKEYIMSYYTDGFQYEGEDDTMKICLRQSEPAPGKRPWAWWTWEATEPIIKKPGPCPTAFRIPGLCYSCERFRITSYDQATGCSHYEDELDYLKRLNLLTENEKQLLEK